MNCGKGFFKCGQRAKQESFNSEALVLVSYKIEWEGHLLEDEFLWEKQNCSVYMMKIFAVNYLAEVLGDDLKKYEPFQIESN